MSLFYRRRRCSPSNGRWTDTNHAEGNNNPAGISQAKYYSIEADKKRCGVGVNFEILLLLAAFP